MKSRRQSRTNSKKLRAVKKLPAHSRSEVAKMKPNDLKKLVHELQARQVELEMQNEELRRKHGTLEAARNRYSELYNLAPTGNLTVDVDGKILEANVSAGRLLEIDQSSLVQKKITQFVAPESQANCHEICQELQSSAGKKVVELVLITAQGNRRIVHMEAQRDMDCVQLRCRLGFMDISSRKRTEIAERDARQFGQSVLDSLALHIAIIDQRGQIVAVNQPWLDFATQNGSKSKDVGVGRNYLAAWASDIKNDPNIAVGIDGLKDVLKGDRNEFYFEYPCHSQNQKRWFKMRAANLIGDSQKRVVVAHEDVTEHQLANDRIIHLNRVGAILRHVDRAIVQLSDRKELLNEICRVAVEHGGFKLAWVGTITWDGSVQPVAMAGATRFLQDHRVTTREDEPAGRGPMGTAIREDKLIVLEDFEFDASTATWREQMTQFQMHHLATVPIHTSGRLVGAFQVCTQHPGVFDGEEMALLTQLGDDISFALTAMEDLAARRTAEEALRRSEHDLTVFFDHSPVGFVWITARGTILRANRALLDLLKCAPVNCLGHAFKEFLVEPNLGIDLLKRMSNQETVRDVRLSLRCQDGAVRHVLMDANSIWKGKQLQYSSVFLRDITDRIILEREILVAGEREHQRIFQDLHDGLGQILAGAAYCATNLRKDLAAKSLPEAGQSKRLLELITEAVTHTRSLAQGIYPVEPVPDGLVVALQALAAKIRKLFHVNCRFKGRRSVLIYDNAVAVHLLRIAQEAATNAIKHGRPRNIEICLTKTPGRISLAVKDDGRGLPIRPRKKSGMGLRIMNYRAGMIGGSLVIQKPQEGGTTVLCNVHVSRRPVSKS